MDDGATYRFPANRRHRYEHLPRFPEGLLVTGDALCAFDPVYGQGMTVAALAAQELARVLAEPGTDLARRFHRRVARHVDTPWTTAAGQVPDERGHVPRTVVGAYLQRLLRAGADDPGLAHAFARVAHLMDPPSTLLHPARVAAVARSGLLPSPRGGVAARRPHTPVEPGRLEEAS